MKKIFSTLAILMTALVINAQNKANPTTIEGKDIYTLLINTNRTTPVGNVTLTQGELQKANSFEERIQFILNKAPQANYNAIVSRDGISVQFVKYVNPANVTEANVPNYSGKEVYFLSNPTKEFTVVNSRLATKEEISSSFYKMAIQLTKEGNKKKFDAIIVSNDKIEYIRYK